MVLLGLRRAALRWLVAELLHRQAWHVFLRGPGRKTQSARESARSGNAAELWQVCTYSPDYDPCSALVRHPLGGTAADSKPTTAVTQRASNAVPMPELTRMPWAVLPAAQSSEAELPSLKSQSCTAAREAMRRAAAARLLRAAAMALSRRATALWSTSPKWHSSTRMPRWCRRTCSAEQE